MSFDEFVRGNSLVARLTLWFTGVAAALVFSTAGLVYAAIGSGTAGSNDNDQLLLLRALAVRQVVDAGDRDVLQREIERADLGAPRTLFVRVSGPGALGILEAPNMPAFATAVRGEPLASDKRFGDVDVGGRRYRTLTLTTPLPPLSGGGFATIEVAIERSAHPTDSTGRLLLAGTVAVAALFAGTFAWWFVVRQQLLPLRRLASAAATVEQSTLDRRVSLEGLPVELEEFAAQFNQMLERLETTYAALRRYADDVAHELRTPINRLQLGAEVALREANDDAYREALESTLEECMHLGRMVTSLLFLARVENGQARLTAFEMNVAERLEKIRAFFEVNAAEAEIDFTVACDEGLSIMADPTLFQRAVSNVLSNAFAHTPRGGRIAVRAAADGTGIVVEIADSGEGIAPEHQARIFDRFYRGDQARVTASGRVGLGLAITKSIVELHQGHVSLQSTPGAGTIVFLHFPAAQTDAANAARPIL
jgi:two-component system heavy metal sensor histidine kinase CusS